jgi:hypothetical protein
MTPLHDFRDELNAVSDSFCIAKWKQVTLHLQTGHTHSCHHPTTHKIPLEEITINPSALHNTSYKKKQRKMMLEGTRPRECDYCWRVEDSGPDAIVFIRAVITGLVNISANAPLNPGTLTSPLVILKLVLAVSAISNVAIVLLRLAVRGWRKSSNMVHIQPVINLQI